MEVLKVNLVIKIQFCELDNLNNRVGLKEIYGYFIVRGRDRKFWIVIKDVILCWVELKKEFLSSFFLFKRELYF